MNSLSLSIAMCTYNGSRHLQQQLDSLASQTLLPDELVVCDDCSNDETPQILKTFRVSAPFSVRIFRNEKNLGPTKNFEKAIQLCQMQLIALADQDDVWHVEKLQRVVGRFRQNPKVAGVFTDAQVVDENSHLLPKTLWRSFSFTEREQSRFGKGHALKILLKHHTVTGATLVFRNEFRELVLPIPENCLHDSWIAFLLASVAEVMPMREFLINYRQHSAQHCGLRRKETFFQEIASSMRTQRNIYLEEVAKLQELRDRLVERSALFPICPDSIPLVCEKIAHQQSRAAYGSSFKRLTNVLKGVVTLRYWRYSNGFRSAVRDLFA